MPLWFIYAISASVVWGWVYAYGKVLMDTISVQSVILLEAIVIAVIAIILLISGNTIASDMKLIQSNNALMLQAIGYSVFTAIGNILVLLSLESADNATIVWIIEMTYPVFIFIFGILALQSKVITLPQIIGGIITFIGVAIILYFE